MKSKTIITAFIFAIFVMVPALPAYAMTPSISLTLGNSIQAIIYGDANSQVFLYSNSNPYNSNGQYNTQYNNNNYNNNGGYNLGLIGMTSANGYLYTTLNPTTYNISNNTSVYVSVNGQNSSTVVWPSSGYSNQYQNQNQYPYNNNYPYNNPSTPIYFSQSNITIAQGQTISGPILGGNYSSNGYYISNNSNSSVVTATLSGATVYLYAHYPGNATITVCQNSGSCATLSITVLENNYASYSSFSPYSTYNYNYPTYNTPSYIAPAPVIIPQYQYQYQYLPATVYNSSRWW